MTGYPWSRGQTLVADELNAAFVNGMSKAIVAPTPPVPLNNPDGTLWWNSTDGQLYVLYHDGNSMQWVAASGALAPGAPYLPLSGGTVTGPVQIGTTPYGATILQFNPVNSGGNSGALFMNKVSGSTITDAPQVRSYWAYDAPSGGGTNPHVNFQTLVSGNCSTWSLLNQTTFYSNDTSPGYGHVGFYSQQVRAGINTGGTRGIGAWSGIFELRSQTGLSSTQDGILQTVELDMLANGADDYPGIGRTVCSIVIGQNNTSGAATEVSCGISFFPQSGHTAHFKHMLFAATPYSVSVLNTVNATQMSGANAIWLRDGHTVAWNTAGTAQTYWDAAALAGAGGIHHTRGLHIDGSSGWSNQNIGKQLFVTNGGNPSIAISDSSGVNIYAIANIFGVMAFASMPALSDSTTAPTYLLSLSAAVNHSTSPFQFDSTVGFNNTAPVAKRTGWTAATGTATRSTFLTSSVTLPVLAEHVKALIDDLTAYGLIGT